VQSLDRTEKFEFIYIYVYVYNHKTYNIVELVVLWNKLLYIQLKEGSMIVKARV